MHILLILPAALIHKLVVHATGWMRLNQAQLKLIPVAEETKCQIGEEDCESH